VKATVEISKMHKTVDNILRIEVKQGNSDLSFVSFYSIVSNKSLSGTECFLDDFNIRIPNMGREIYTEERRGSGWQRREQDKGGIGAKLVPLSRCLETL
jgi:hypothetical protein